MQNQKEKFVIRLISFSFVSFVLLLLGFGESVTAADCLEGEINEVCSCDGEDYSEGYCCHDVYFDGDHYDSCSTGNYYFVDGSRSDDTGDGASWATAKRYIRSGMNLMQGGDVLIIADGIYTNGNDQLTHGNAPPNGISTQYSTLKAQHIGGVILDGGADFWDTQRSMFDVTGAAYVQFDGIVLKHSWNGMSISNSNHVKIINCGVMDTAYTAVASFSFASSSYCLIEDSWAWGYTRYSVLFYESNHMIARRVVARIDRCDNIREPVGHFRTYTSRYTDFQNCIAIDSDQRDYYYVQPGRGALYGSFYHSGPGDDYWRGCIVLNNKLPAGWMGHTDEQGNHNFIDTVMWDNWGGVNPQGGELNMNHLTINTNYALADANGIQMGTGVGIYNCWAATGLADVAVRNSIIYSNPNYGLRDVCNNGRWISDYNCMFNPDSTNYRYVIPGANDFSTENGNEINPIWNVSSNPNGGLKYILKIENDSSLSGVASDNGDIGATALYEIGKSGSLWGEDGWNETTTNSLWPWKNEEVIKTQLASYSSVGTMYDGTQGTVHGNRGFAASGNGLYGGPITLTSYIWEYLGNSCPNDICDYGEDTTPPSRSNPQPTGTLTSGTTSTTISLDTDETAICKYSRIIGTNYDLMTLQLSSGQANSHSTTVSNLEDGNSYTYYVRCQDESGNQNIDDFEISFSVASSQTYSISNFINLVTDWLKSESGLESDVNGDGVVNTRDLGIMMSNWQ